MVLLILFDYFSGIAGNDHIIRDVMRNDRTGANDHTVTDGDTRTHNHSAAQPAVIADAYRQTCFYSLAALHIIMGWSGVSSWQLGPISV